MGYLVLEYQLCSKVFMHNVVKLNVLYIHISSIMTHDTRNSMRNGMRSSFPCSKRYIGWEPSYSHKLWHQHFTGSHKHTLISCYLCIELVIREDAFFLYFDHRGIMLTQSSFAQFISSLENVQIKYNNISFLFFVTDKLCFTLIYQNSKHFLHLF